MVSSSSTTTPTQGGDDHGVVGAVVAAAKVGGGDGDGSVQADDVAQHRRVRDANADAFLGAHVVHGVPKTQPLQPLAFGHHAADACNVREVA